MRFRHLLYSLVPSWLRTGDGEKLLYSIGLLLDGFAERWRLSGLASDPTTAPDDALSYLGRDRRITRGRAESSSDYADRLLGYLDAHRAQGNPFTLMDQLYAYLQTSGVTIRTVDRRGNWFERASDGTRSYTLNQMNWDWDGGLFFLWSRFWVIIFSDNGPWSTQWNHPGGSATDGTTDATEDEIAAVRAIIRDWKPAHARCEWIIVCFDAPAGKFGPATGDDPGGAWGVWSSGTPRRPVRHANSRYWVGER